MRAFAWIAAAVLVVGCGDNYTLSPDAFVPQCSDEVDNDGDGMTDYPDDLGCDHAADESEDSPPKPKCSDNRDNDGDGKVDYPDDPGCVAEVGDDEADDCPSGPGCPQCGNGIDDDGNGMTDYPADLGCSSAGDPIEFIDDPTACGVGLVIKQLPMTGMDMGMLDGTSISGVGSICGGGGGAPAVAYVFYLPRPRVVVATTDLPMTTADTVLDLRSAMCDDPGSSVGCNDDLLGGNKKSRLVASVPAGTYYLIVEGYDAAALGSYGVEVDFYLGEGEPCTMTSECGEGLVCRIPVNGSMMVCSDPVCNDGLDDDADTKIDFPNDPGCTSPTDDTEDDDCPSGPMCPECADGQDNDGDGQTDYPADTSCTSASGAIESCQGEEDPVLSITTGMTTGTTVGAHDNHDPTCGSDGGPDVLFTLALPAMRTLTLDTDNSSFDTLLSLMTSTCTEPGLECDDDDGTTSGASLITRTNLAEGLYIVAVDEYGTGQTPGPFTLNVSGTIAPGGRCDPAFTLGGALTCPAANPCEGTAGNMRCRPTLCIDGIDNDGDSKTDYPNDPGCVDINDETEDDVCATMPTDPACPDCANGLDDDSDGMIDYPADTNCLAASGSSESCVQSEPVPVITQPSTMGDTSGATNDFMPPPGTFNGHLCSTTGTHTAPDVAYQLDLPAMTTLNLNINPVSYDSAHILLNSTCMGTPIECTDSPSMPLTNLSAGTYYVIVDGYSTSSGTFTLNVSGTIADGASCESPLAQAGALTCGAGHFCGGPAGSQTCMPTQCADGIDNNGVGGMDYPNDPGCTSPSDPTEDTVCPGASCPVCANGMDDDADTFTDYPADDGCPAAWFVIENFCPVENNPPEIIAQPMTFGTMASPATDDYDQSCQSNTTNDVAYLLRLPVPVATLRLDTGGSTVPDTVLSLHSAACTTSLGCNDDGMGTLSLLTLSNVAAGDYTIQVDGWGGSSNNGPFRLNVLGTVAAGTDCTSPLFGTGVLVCPTGTTCTGGTCQ